MSSTNKTAELQLSQFVGTDIPSILTDYNGDMRKIDAGVLEVKQATAGAVSDLSSVTARVTNAEQSISGLNSTVQGIATRVVTAEGEIDTLQGNVSQIESVIPATASTSNKLATIDDIGGSGAITALKARMTTAEDDIDNIEAVIPATASTTNQLATVGDIEGYTPSYKNVTSEIGILDTDTVKEALDKIHNYLGTNALSKALRTIIKIDTKLFRLEKFDTVFIFSNRSIVYSPAEETAPVNNIVTQEDYLFITNGTNLYQSKYYRHTTNDSVEVGWSDLGSNVATVTVYTLS